MYICHRLHRLRRKYLSITIWYQLQSDIN